MSVATKTIKIDLWRALLEPIKVVQREAAGRTLSFQITDGGPAYDLTGKVVTFYATKPDGTTIFNAVTVVDNATGKINYTMTSQTSVAPGALVCTLIITAASEETRTQPFTVTIVASPDYTSAVESADEFTALTALAGEIADHEARLDAITATAEELNFTAGVTSAIQTQINGIIESGSNANGFWVKYADGTMIQRNVIANTEIGAQSELDVYCAFPLSFYAAPSFIAGGMPSLNWAGFFCSGAGNSSTPLSSGQAHFFNGPTTQNIVRLTWLAIGRWKA